MYLCVCLHDMHSRTVLETWEMITRTPPRESVTSDSQLPSFMQLATFININPFVIITKTINIVITIMIIETRQS